MKQIEEYVNSVYRNVDGNQKEINELKEEMKSHLIESVHELKLKGKSEDEAIRIAINNFGDTKQITKGLSEFFNVHKRFSRYILWSSILSLFVGIFLIFNTLHKVSDFNKEKKSVPQEILGILGTSNEITKERKEEILDVFDEHRDHLRTLAIFKRKEYKEIQVWSTKYNVRDKPLNVYPIDYKYATTIIGGQGEVPNYKDITMSEYDLGTIAMTNENWVVQFDYQSTYHDVIETNNALILKSYLEIFLTSIFFLLIFGILIIVWSFLKRHHNSLKNALNKFHHV